MAIDPPARETGPKTSPAPAQDAGLEAPLTPTADPTRKTSSTHDPDATDPGNGAD
jgi:hypothetical protein